MQYYKVLNDKEGIGLHKEYAMATSTEAEHDKHRITAGNSIMNSRQIHIVANRHLQLYKLDALFIMTEIGSWFVI